MQGWGPASVPAGVVLLCYVMVVSSQDHSSCVILFVQVSTAFCHAPWTDSRAAVIITFVLSVGNGSLVEYVQIC